MFICPHTSAEQTSSGTLSFAMASGATVVATPFAQAAELFRGSASGSPGVLVPFNSSVAIAEAVRHAAPLALRAVSLTLIRRSSSCHVNQQP